MALTAGLAVDEYRLGQLVHRDGRTTVVAGTPLRAGTCREFVWLTDERSRGVDEVAWCAAAVRTGSVPS